MNRFSNFFRIVLLIDQKSQGAYTVQNAGIHTFGYVPTGVRQRPDGVRSVVNIIKPKMVTDGLNTKGLWYSRKHIRLKYHELLFALREKSLMSQNGLFVREWRVDQIHIGQVSM
jgi:hypothetical protein